MNLYSLHYDQTISSLLPVCVCVCIELYFRSDFVLGSTLHLWWSKNLIEYRRERCFARIPLKMLWYKRKHPVCSDHTVNSWKLCDGRSCAKRKKVLFAFSTFTSYFGCNVEWLSSRAFHRYSFFSPYAAAAFWFLKVWHQFNKHIKVIMWVLHLILNIKSSRIKFTLSEARHYKRVFVPDIHHMSGLVGL